MIEKVIFSNLAECEFFSYAAKLPFFQLHKEIVFKPGMNIFFGANGKGKSTVLNMIAKATASEAGGISCVTQRWVNELFPFYGKKMGFNVVHDGQSVVFSNPRIAFGLIGNSFDDDFFDDGVKNAMLHESTGFTTIHRLNSAFAYMSKEKDIPCKFDIREKVRLKDEITKFIEGQIEKGQKTIVLDEPESGLAFAVQMNLWRNISDLCKKNDIQLIIATHSPFSLLCDANFIEMEDGHIASAKLSIKYLAEALAKE